MRNIINCAKLDARMVMAYQRSVIILLLLPIAFILIFDHIGPAMSVAAFMALSIIGYPFSIEESCRFPLRLRSMPVSVREMVWGRYLFILGFAALFLLAVLAESFLVGALLKKGFNWGEGWIGFLFVLCLVIFIAAWQIPIYYRFGYRKAGKWITAGFVGFGVSAVFMAERLLAAGPPAPGFLPPFFFSSRWLFIAALCFVLFCLFISGSASISIYGKKET